MNKPELNLRKMEIEEITCLLCSEVYNETNKIPILLPDCGHSFCYSCIKDCFEIVSLENNQLESE